MTQQKEQQVLDSIRARMARLPGHLGFYYQNLVSGYTYGVKDDEAFLAASVIKLPLYLHILSEAEAGRVSMEEKLTVTDEDKMPSCGALTLFTGPVEVDVHTLCRLMIDLSDNTATNKLIRHCTMEGVQQGFCAMGLEKTKLRRLLFDSKASAAGIQNTICPREMGRLLSMLYREEFVNPRVSREAMKTLTRQQINHKLNGRLCGVVPIAHKTGEDDHLSNDVGIVMAAQPFVVCYAGHDTDVYAWEDLIRNSAYELCQAQQTE